MLRRFEQAGLSELVTPLEATTGELLVTWLTPSSATTRRSSS